jgi:hypothetical protein
MIHLQIGPIAELKASDEAAIECGILDSGSTGPH